MIDNSQTQTPETQKSISPQQALDLLKDGNNRFMAKRQLSRDLGQQVAQTAGGQYPFATVLGCIDSRVPAEIIFDQGIGDIFNVRIAGNFANDDILGSLEFACKVAGSKAIVVLGHSSCGAIKGACDDVQLGNLTGMLQNLKPAVDAVEGEKENRSSKNVSFVQKVVDMNIKMTVETIKQRSSILKGMVDHGEIAIVGAMYDVGTGKVIFN